LQLIAAQAPRLIMFFALTIGMIFLRCSVRQYCKRTFTEDAERFLGMSRKPVTICGSTEN
jgi:hypothetical protein